MDSQQEVILGANLWCREYICVLDDSISFQYWAGSYFLRDRCQRSFWVQMGKESAPLIHCVREGLYEISIYPYILFQWGFPSSIFSGGLHFLHFFQPYSSKRCGPAVSLGGSPGIAPLCAWFLQNAGCVIELLEHKADWDVRGSYPSHIACG